MPGVHPSQARAQGSSAVRFLVCRRMVRRSLLLFLGAALSVFCLSLLGYAISPLYAGFALDRIMSFYEHHFDFLQKVLSDLAFIFLNNSLAVFVAMGLGSTAVWWILGSSDPAPSVSRASAPWTRWAVRASEALLDAVHRLALCVHPHLREVPGVPMQQTMAVSVLPPVLSLAVNGAMMGIWAAWYLTRLQWSGLGKAVLGILPHGVIELPTIWVAAASGLYISGRLIGAGREGPEGVRHSLRALVRSQALWRTLAVFLLMIAAAASLETRVSWELQETLLAQTHHGTLP